MDEKDFYTKMENLKKPEISVEASQRQIKLAVLNAKRSAGWGIWFLIAPIFFFACVAIKYFLKWDWNVAGSFLDWIPQADKSIGVPLVSILLFIILPGIGAIINLLAIMHFVFDKVTRELIVTIKLKWLNILLAVISLAIIGMVLLYAVSENSAERAIHRMEAQKN